MKMIRFPKKYTLDTLPETNMTMEEQQFEDVFLLIKDGDFPL